MRWKAPFACCLALCIGSVAFWSFVAEAQSPPKVYRIGWLSPFAISTLSPGTVLAGYLSTFTQTLNDLGYVEGRNLAIDSRYAEGKNERLQGLAAELVALKPDVIIAETTPATRAALQATTTIPIVMVQVSDPVGSGFVASLARPGGNATGVKDFDIEVAPKKLELAHALVPKATRIGVLIGDHPIHPALLRATQDAATRMGLTLLPVMDRSDEELQQAFASLAKENAGALIVLGGELQGRQAVRIAEFAARARLPAVYPSRYYVRNGGLLSYSPSDLQAYKMAASFVDKIFKGAKPGDLPVEQPTLFDLVINDKAVKALGITIPPSMLITAEVIQ